MASLIGAPSEVKPTLTYVWFIVKLLIFLYHSFIPIISIIISNISNIKSNWWNIEKTWLFLFYTSAIHDSQRLKSGDFGRLSNAILNFYVFHLMLVRAFFQSKRRLIILTFISIIAVIHGQMIFLSGYP